MKCKCSLNVVLVTEHFKCISWKSPGSITYLVKIREIINPLFVKSHRAFR